MKRTIAILLAVVLMVSAFPASMLAFAEDTSGYFLTDYVYDDMISSEDGTLFAYQNNGQDGGKTVFSFDENGKATALGTFHFRYWYPSWWFSGNITFSDDELGNIELHSDGSVYAYEPYFFDEDYFRISQTGRIGMAGQTGKIVVPCLYDDVWRLGDHLEGYFIAILGEKFGCYDEEGNLVFSVEYDLQEGILADGLNLHLTRDGMYGVVDQEGHIVIPFEYDTIIHRIQEDYYLVEKNGLRGLLDQKGEMVLPVAYDVSWDWDDNTSPFYQNGTLEAVLYQGKLLFPPEGYQIESIINSEGGYMDITYNGWHGIMNGNGDIVLPCEYHSIDYDGFAVKTKKNNQYGLSTLEGKTIVPCEYDEISIDYENSYKISRDEKFGLVKDGVLSLPCEYDRLVYVTDYDVVVVAKGEKYGLLKPDGTVLVDFAYFSGSIFSDGLWAVRDGSTWKMGYVDMDGKIAIGFQYDECFPFYDGIARARLGGEDYFIDKTGKVLSKYASADWFYHIQKNFFGICKNDLWGVYDALSGEIILPCEFDYATLLGTEYFEVEKEGKRGVLDYDGNIVLPCVYDMIWGFLNGTDTDSQSVLLTKDGKQGYMNLKSRILVEPGIYDEFNGWVDQTLVKVEKEGKWGLLSWEGNLILPCEYDFIYQEYTGLIRFYKDGESGCVNQSGKVIVRCGERESFNVRTDDSWNPIIIEVTRQVNGENKQGLVSLNGEEILPPEYVFVHNYRDDDSVTFAHRDGKVGVIDAMGNFILLCEYEGGYSLSRDGDVHVLSKDEKYGLIDTRGMWVLPCEYDGIYTMYGDNGKEIDGLSFIRRGDQFGCIDSQTGGIVFACEYETLEYLGEDLFFTVKGRERQVVTREGTPVFDEEYQWVYPFSNGLAQAIAGDGSSCFVNVQGTVVFTLEDGWYTAYDTFSNGYMLIVSEEEWIHKIIDTKGNCVTPYLNYITDAVMGKNGIIGVGRESGEGLKWCLINAKKTPIDIPEIPGWRLHDIVFFGFIGESDEMWGYNYIGFDYDQFYIGDGLHLLGSYSFSHANIPDFYEVTCDLISGNASLADDWLVFTGAGEVKINFSLREKGTGKILEQVQRTLTVQGMDISQQPVSAIAPKDRSIKLGDDPKTFYEGEEYGWESTAWVVNNPRIGAAYKTETTNLTMHDVHASDGPVYYLTENRTRLENLDQLQFIQCFTEAGVYREELFVQNPGDTEWTSLGSYEITVEEPVIEITAPDRVQPGDTATFSSMLTNVAEGLPEYEGWDTILFDSSVEVIQGANLVTSSDKEWESRATNQTLSFTGEGIVKLKVTYTVKAMEWEWKFHEEYGFEPCDIGNYSISKIVTIAVGDAEETVILLEEDPDGGLSTASNIGLGTTVAEVLTSLQNHDQVPKGYHASILDSDGNAVDLDAVVGTGMQIVFESEESADNRAFTIVVFGDASGDGEISIFDIMAQRDHIFGKHRLEGAYLKAGKLDGSDEEINIFDIMAIRDHIFGKTLIAGTGEDL